MERKTKIMRFMTASAPTKARYNKFAALAA